MDEETPLLDQNIEPQRDSRNTIKYKIIGGCLALTACFTFTWIAFFVKSFNQDVTDVLFIRSALQSILFACVLKYYKIPFWLEASDYESNVVDLGQHNFGKNKAFKCLNDFQYVKSILPKSI